MAETPFWARLNAKVPMVPLRAVVRAGGEELAPVLGETLHGARLSASFAFEDDVFTVAVEARDAVAVETCAVELRHAFPAGEQVLLNGYQSWTDTVECSAWERMRGLLGVPRTLVEKFALDGGGDYRFAEYSARRGFAHGWTYATFRRGDSMVLLGSLCESRGFTKICTRAPEGLVVVEPECPVAPLGPGQRVELVRFALVAGTQDECYDSWFALAGRGLCAGAPLVGPRPRPRPRKPLVGYSSWYRHYGDITAEKLVSDLDGASRALDPAALRARGALPLFQIDDGYCKVGDWLSVDPGKFPDGLAPLARAARDAGFLPGLWVAPFVCERESRVFAEHDEWLLRDAAGNLVATGCQWSGGFALDVRNPEVRTYVLEVLQAMVEEWGFGLLKCDFLYGACMEPHDGLNRGQLMADALHLLRTGAGDDCLLLGCGVPLGSAFGVLDYCRIGCDVGLDWDDAPHMRVLHRERVSTKNSLANTRGRAPLDGRAFGNDPDVFFLRGDVRLSAAQKEELLAADAACGSVFLTSDDMGAWDAAARGRYAAALDAFLARRAALESGRAR